MKRCSAKAQIVRQSGWLGLYQGVQVLDCGTGKGLYATSMQAHPAEVWIMSYKTVLFNSLMMARSLIQLPPCKH